MFLSGVSEMKQFICLVAVIGSLVGCSSFREVRPEVKLREFAPEDSKAASKIAADFAGGFIRALETGEFSFWQKQLPSDSAAKITPAKFAAMRRELQAVFGEFHHAEALGKIISGNLHNYLWKLSFVRSSSGRKVEGKEVYEVVYFVRIFCEEGKEPAVSGFGVKRF